MFLKANPYYWLGGALGALLVLLAAYFYGVSNGRASVTAEWEKSKRIAVEKVLTEAVRTQDTKTAAEAKGRDKKAEAEERFKPIEKKVIEYVQTEAAAVPCFTPDDDGARLLQEAIDAANSALAESAK